MNQETLNSLKPGEKAVDIQEYYWGVNGHMLVYKVTIYSCTKILFWNHISKFTFPFYFATKEIATNFLEQYEKFDIDIDFYLTGAFNDCSNAAYVLKPKGIKKPKYTYWMIATTTDYSVPCSQSKHLYEGDVWGGFVNNFGKSKCYNSDNLPFKKIFEIEEMAAKEGTTGKTFSYKLQSIE